VLSPLDYNWAEVNNERADEACSTASSSFRLALSPKKTHRPLVSFLRHRPRGTMATATPQQCCLPARARPPPTSTPLRLRYLSRAASSFHFPGRRTVTARRRGRAALAFSPRCTLETGGPAFDPLGLYREDPSSSDYQPPFSTLFGVLSPVFGSSSGSRKEKSSYGRGAAAAMEDSTIDFGDFFKGPLPGKFLKLLGFLALSRLGVYIPLGGVNQAAFAGNLDQNSLLGTLDSFSGGGIGRLGICSLGIVPFINAQIVFQLLTQLYPKLQELQKKEGEAGRKKILQYTRYASVGFAIAQAIGQVLFLRPYVNDFSTEWVLTSVTLLTLGSVFTTFLGETISELKLGNGTSLLIFTSIISYLPASFGRTVAEGFQAGNYVGLLTIILSFFFLVLGIVYVQVRKYTLLFKININLSAYDLLNSHHFYGFRKLREKYH
uniref:CpSecY n=1 Tax=Aegilops tauschii subsp. strangulata TaxID=200361 RepID=A0A453KG19_AEGTS